jgi:hypothetical protein
MNNFNDNPLTINDLNNTKNIQSNEIKNEKINNQLNIFNNILKKEMSNNMGGVLIPPQVLTNNSNDIGNFNPILSNDEKNLLNIQNNSIDTQNNSINTQNNYFNHFVSKPDFENQSMHGILLPQNSWNSKILSSQNVIDEAEDIIKNLSKLEPSKYIHNNNEVPHINKNDMTSISQPYTSWNEYKRPTDIYYDNLNKDGKTEIITQNIITFDSADRDLNKYLDPFSYRVKFNPSQGNTDAYISRNYKNVKFFSLDYVILPRKFYIKKIQIVNNPIFVNLFNNFNNVHPNSQILDELTTYVIITTYIDGPLRIIVYTLLLPEMSDFMTVCWEITYDTSNDTYTTYQFNLTTLSLEYDKFLLVFIDEISNAYGHSTNEFIDNAFGVVMPNFVNQDYYYLDTKLVEKIYRYSDLGNIDQITLRITNSKGVPITLNKNAIDTRVKTKDVRKCICSKDSNGNYVRNYSCACTYMRHPLYVKFQNNILFKLGFIEPDIDKRVFN